MSKWDLQWSVSDPDTFVTFSSDKLEINLHRLTGKADSSSNTYGWQYKQASKAELYLRSRADLQGVKVRFNFPKLASMPSNSYLKIWRGKKRYFSTVRRKNIKKSHFTNQITVEKKFEGPQTLS